MSSAAKYLTYNYSEFIFNLSKKSIMLNLKEKNGIKVIFE